MAPVFMAVIELVPSGRPNADGGQCIRSPSPNKRQLKAVLSDLWKLAPSGSNEPAPYVRFQQLIDRSRLEALRDDESAGCDRHARPGFGGLRA